MNPVKQRVMAGCETNMGEKYEPEKKKLFNTHINCKTSSGLPKQLKSLNKQVKCLMCRKKIIVREGKTNRNYI